MCDHVSSVVVRPSGGALVFAVNSLHYLNQSYPSVDISLNSITDTSTNVPLSEGSCDLQYSMQCIV